MSQWTPRQEAFRVWALARMKEYDQQAKSGRWAKAEATAACVELWAALDFVLDLGVKDWSKAHG